MARCWMNEASPCGNVLECAVPHIELRDFRENEAKANPSLFGFDVIDWSSILRYRQFVETGYFGDLPLFRKKEYRRTNQLKCDERAYTSIPTTPNTTF